MSPAITVLMPVYNGALYLAESIESVLAQSFDDFELLIIDDGSTDDSEQIYQRFISNDPRISVYKQPNGGIAKALNKGLELARGELIARLDSDDIMLPARLEVQEKFLRENPKYGFCASAMDVIDEAGKVRATYHPVPSTDDELDALLRRRALMTYTHPTVTMRRDLAIQLGGYSTIFEPCEDTDLFTRMISAGAPGIALPQILTRYRMHAGSISGKRAKRQVEVSELVRRNLYARLSGGVDMSLPEWDVQMARRPWFTRYLTEAENRSHALRQTARYDFVSGYLARARSKQALAFALRPGAVANAIIKRIFGRRSQDVGGSSSPPQARWDYSPNPER